MGVTNLTVNWDRSVMVKGPINESLFEELSPTILRMRQSSGDPITVGIDSYGGSLTAMEAILALLEGPHQATKTAPLVGVAINNAFSAAATLLTLTDYAVAFPHSTILFHDVRYQGLEDVTPEKALATAKQLTLANEKFSLKMAPKVVERLLWVYMALKDTFTDARKRLPKTTKKFEAAFGKHFPITANHPFDLVGFTSALYLRLTRVNDHLLLDASSKLSHWIEVRDAASLIPIERQKGSRIPGLLDGPLQLYKQLSKSMGTPDSTMSEQDKTALRILLALCIRRMAQSRQNDNLDPYMERLLSDYAFVKNMEDDSQIHHILRTMRMHSYIFFGPEEAKILEGTDEQASGAILDAAVPQVRIFWYFCVLLCRALFDGEHRLNAYDALRLGLVDEVVGGTAGIQSVREYLLTQEDKKKDDGAE